MDRYICIHGHFYQPPRENPWLEAIELQDSAYPYHDWNERIDSECYSPNAASRILDQAGQIVRIVSNYEKISFDFGPTLLSWMEEKAPETYQAILEADFESLKTFSGHGSAIAQAYNHTILPLANRRDKITQIAWGISDFEHRFRRRPEGIWLPETAVDIESLEIASEHGIRFTILAPHQARRVRKIGERNWRDVSGSSIDPTIAYTLRLPSQREMAIFFYDGPTSRAVAFEHLLDNGVFFAGRIVSGLSPERSGPRIAHIATDGETYGHHHRFGDMALAFALQHIETSQLAQITNYGEFLERHPPAFEVEIAENTSWSCAHGVERWRGNCGCNSGAHARWNQSWRGPLRQSLDWLRDTIAPLYESGAQDLLRSPWLARNDYIDVVLDRSNDSIERFFARHATRALNPVEMTTALKLLEVQRNAMLMYTSCGWFFDDISGIETVQILQYAGRAIQIAEHLSGEKLEPQFLAMLENARSNVTVYRDGRHIWERSVRPAMVNLEKVGAHYAVSSLFENGKHLERIGCYSLERLDSIERQAGRTRMAMGRVRVTCSLTRDSAVLGFNVIHFGGHNIAGGVMTNPEAESFERIAQEMREAFGTGDFPQLLRLLDRHFGQSVYSLRSLFRDEQRRILGIILENTLAEAETVYRELYRDHAPLMQLVREMGIPLPKAFHTAAEFVLNTDIRRALESVNVDLNLIDQKLSEARAAGIAFDAPGLAFAFKRVLERMMEELFENPPDLPTLEKLARAAALARSLQINLDLQKVQNTFWELRQWAYPDIRQRSDAGDADARKWAGLFLTCGKALGVSVD
jgi:alpha-amylase/alpha-mannosidase (GH57 family)